MKLCKQIWNERKHNFWIWLELFVVSVILWFVIDMLYVVFSYTSEPVGFDIENTYTVCFTTLEKECPEYTDSEKSGINDGKAVLEIASRLRQHPDIEYVSISQASYPYCQSSSANYYTCDTFGQAYRCCKITPDFMNVFRYQGVDGEKPSQLAQILKENRVVISSYFFPKEIKKQDVINKTIAKSKGKPMTIGCVCAPIKIFDYEQYMMDVIFIPMSEEEIIKNYNTSGWWSVNVRVKPEADKGFPEKLFAEAESHYRVGNLLMIGVKPLYQSRNVFQLQSFNATRNKVAIAGFLLLNIFFGILGTFWFRTQRRRHEIALLRAIGSTRLQIYVRILGEGILILLGASVCAWVVDYIIANMQLTLPYYGETISFTRSLLTMGGTLICMSVMVLIGIMIPARQAQNIEISTALHED